MSETMNKTTSKKKYLYVALGIGALTVVALPIFAAGKYCGGHGGGHWFGGGHGAQVMSERMIEKLSHKLDLEDDQRDALYAAADEVRPEMREMRRQLLESRDALRDLDPNAADYDALVAELADKHGEMARQATTMAAAMKSTLVEVLNDEQMEELKEMMSRKHRRGHDD